MALNQEDPFCFGFFYKLTLTFLRMISFPALGGIGVFISGIVNPIIKSVKFFYIG